MGCCNAKMEIMELRVIIFAIIFFVQKQINFLTGNKLIFAVTWREIPFYS